MSGNTNRALRGGVRAVTGVLIVGVAATTAVLVGAAPLPGVTREPVSLQADTSQGGDRSFVCAGSFAELGADERHPGVAVPSGTSTILRSGVSTAQRTLERETSGGTPPTVLEAAGDQPFAAAQVQHVETDALRGLTAQSCAEPVNEQWLVGGSTAVGTSTTVNLVNPGGKPATVQLTVFDENGEVASAQTSGVLVPAGSERIVSLNGYAPERESLAVRVVSTGATVTASLGVGQVDGLHSFAVDVVTRQLEPSTSLVIPGIVNLTDAGQRPNDIGDGDASQVLVRALSTSRASGTATVRAVFGDGTSKALGTLELSGEKVGQLTVKEWPVKANAVVIDADVPIVGGVMSAALAGPDMDAAWFAPAPELSADTEVAAAVASGGRLVLVNTGEGVANVRVSGSGTAEQSYRVPAGAAVAVLAETDARITSDAPIHAGVSIARNGDIAGYPVLTPVERGGAVTVYPR